MPIIVHNHEASANISFAGGHLDIDFADPSYVRCESIVINMDSREIGAILHEGYHGMGQLPDAISLQDVFKSQTARLSGLLSSGETFRLSAPVKFFN